MSGGGDPICDKEDLLECQPIGGNIPVSHDVSGDVELLQRPTQ